LHSGTGRTHEKDQEKTNPEDRFRPRHAGGADSQEYLRAGVVSLTRLSLFVKDGKEHRYWSIVESVRTRRGLIKRQVLYLGEINDAQRAQWCSALECSTSPAVHTVR
jgi:hypothetical protein